MLINAASYFFWVVRVIFSRLFYFHKLINKMLLHIPISFIHLEIISNLKSQWC
ncbi:hypothetical protein Pint_23209 [Pistacia integerrima]|uniref:Uncharacterized protein n=1 Tax=Pistacia integerrima TaxID=434235 RepID=A0ACC0YK25_9ROSI|nr:hypothetical protein Pint_23209 [Pistacia integerrima]